jgi:hypothetical protein
MNIDCLTPDISIVHDQALVNNEWERVRDTEYVDCWMMHNNFNNYMSNVTFTGCKLEYSSFAKLRLGSTRIKFVHCSLRFCTFYTPGAIYTFEDCDIRYCIGEGKYMKSLQIGEYKISYTHDTLAIGCQQYKIADWPKLNPLNLSIEDGELLEKHLHTILNLIATFPAEKADV